MSRRPRIRRRIVKWVGLVACVVICAAWVLTIFRTIRLGGRPFTIALIEGGFKWVSPVHSPEHFYDPWIFKSHRVVWLPYRQPTGSAACPTDAWFVPLWIPFLLIAVPTVIAWRRDRRPKPGHCRCGYNLEGNVSGRCPECGTTT